MTQRRSTVEARVTDRIILNDAGEPWFSVEVESFDSPLRGGAPQMVSAAANSIADVGDVIAKACNDIMTALQDGMSGVLPQEMEISFGVTIGAEAGLPALTKASGEATFAVRALWKPAAGNPER
jgi:hypothetical protein